MHDERTAWRVLFALVLFDLLIKLLWLGRPELAHDEPFTVLMAQRSWPELFAALRMENNPPLHFILTKLWSGMVPLDAAWLRVPSALASALAIGPLFLLARSLGGLRVAIVASLLFALNNYHYGIAQEVRGYALFTGLATTGMWQLQRLSTKAPRALLWLCLANVAMVYTHFFGWIMVGLQVLIVLSVISWRPARRPVLIAMGVTLLSFAPYLLTFFSRMTSSVEQGTWLTAPQPEELYNMIWRWSNAPVLAVLFMIVIVIAAVRRKGLDSGMRIGLYWSVLPLLGMYLISYRVPIFLDRYLVFAAPGFCLLVALSLAALLKGRWKWLPSSIAVAAMALTFTPWKDKELHPSRVVAQAKAWQVENGPILIAPHFYAPTFAWHWDKKLFQRPEELDKSLADQRFHPIYDPEWALGLEDAEAVVLIDSWSALTDPEQRTKQLLRARWPEVDSVEADHKVWVYRFHGTR